MIRLRQGYGGLVAAGALLFTSCAGHHQPPSSARLDKATVRLSAAVEKAGNTAERAQAKVVAAQKAADKEAAASASVLTQLAELKKVAPPELQGRIASLEGAVNEQQTAASEVVSNLSGARHEHEQLGKDLIEARSAKDSVVTEKELYKAAVAVVTDKLNAAEKQLLREKVISILWKVGGGIFVVLIIIGVALWWTGKLGILGAKIAARF